MPVDTGHQAQADCSPYRLCNLSLVFWSQPGIPRVLYAAHLGHVLRHDGEVLPVQLLAVCSLDSAHIPNAPCTPRRD